MDDVFIIDSEKVVTRDQFREDIQPTDLMGDLPISQDVLDILAQEEILDVQPSVWNPDESNLYQHAKRELELLGEEEMITKPVLEIVAIFAQMGHSGSSAAFTVGLLEQLLRFQNLTPLTDNPDEWINVDGVNTWQNRRCFSAFSTNGGKSYYLLSEDIVRDPQGNPIATHASVPAKNG